MRKLFFTLLFIILIAGTNAKNLFAHPHVFINVSVNFLFDDKGLKGIRETWRFDELFSSAIISEFDLDKNMKLDMIENRMVQKGAFDNLAEFKYYTYIKYAGEVFRPDTVKDFEATVDGGVLVYKFTIPFEKSFEMPSNSVSVYVYDEQFYADAKISNNVYIHTLSDNNPNYAFRVEKDKSRSFYFGLSVPDRVDIIYSKGGSDAPSLEFAEGFTKGDGSDTQVLEDAKPGGDGFSGLLRRYVFKYQQQLNTSISEKLRAYKNNENSGFLFVLIGMAFLYGVIHAAGPGHGKSVAASYFISKGGKLIEPFTFGFLNSFIHAFSSVILIMGFKLFMDSFKFNAFGYISNPLQIASYSLVVLIGLVMLYGALKDTRKLKKDYFDVYGEGFGVDTKELPARRSMFSLIITTGIVPCPGALVIMLTCYSIGAAFLGLLLVGAMAFGMSMTVTTAGLIALAARKGAMKKHGDNNVKSPIFHAFRIAGALFVILAGGVMLAGKLIFI